MDPLNNAIIPLNSGQSIGSSSSSQQTITSPQTLQKIEELLLRHGISLPTHKCQYLYEKSVASITSTMPVEFVNITKQDHFLSPQPKIHIFPHKEKNLVNLYLRSRDENSAKIEADRGSTKSHRRNICCLSLDFNQVNDAQVSAKSVSQLVLTNYNNILKFNYEIDILEELKDVEKYDFLLDAAINFVGSKAKQPTIKSVAYVETYEKDLAQFIEEDLPQYSKDIEPATLATFKLNIIRKTLEDFVKVHRSGYIHIDPKTDNILIRCIVPPKQDENALSNINNFKTIVNDFDQSIRVSEIATLPVLLGTPMMFGPENMERWTQASNHTYQLSQKTDIWALGGTFVELLTGKLPRWSALIWSMNEIFTAFPVIRGRLSIITPSSTSETVRTIKNFENLLPHAEEIYTAMAPGWDNDQRYIVERVCLQLKRVNEIVNQLDPQSMAQLLLDQDFTDLIYSTIYDTIGHYTNYFSSLQGGAVKRMLEAKMYPIALQLAADLKNLVWLTWAELAKTPRPVTRSREELLVWSLLRPNPEERPTAQEALALI